MTCAQQVQRVDKGVALVHNRFREWIWVYDLSTASSGSGQSFDLCTIGSKFESHKSHW